MWKVLNEVMGRIPSKKTVINELKDPNGTTEEEVNIANTLKDLFLFVGEVLNANILLANRNAHRVYLTHIQNNKVRP